MTDLTMTLPEGKARMVFMSGGALSPMLDERGQ